MTNNNKNKKLNEYLLNNAVLSEDGYWHLFLKNGGHIKISEKARLDGEVAKYFKFPIVEDELN